MECSKIPGFDPCAVIVHVHCNNANGRVDFEDGWLIKSSFITDQGQSPTKKQKNNPST